MKRLRRLIVVLVATVTVAAGTQPAGATSGFESGTCLLDLEARLTGNTLSLVTTGYLGTPGNGICVTDELPEVVGEGAIDASLPGIVGFTCQYGLVVGAVHNGIGGLEILVGDDTILAASNMTIAAASDGVTLTIAFHWQSALRVIVGKGVFALETDSPSCSSGNPTTWTGEIVFADPALP